MIRLFRKIRHQLLSEDKYPIYLLYALGEILLVVVGILLALQIDNWNERRKEQQFEEKLLVDVRNSIIDGYGLINWAIESNERSKESCHLILNQFKNDLPYHDSLDLHFENANLWWKIIPRKYAYDRAKSYGLDFVKDDTIRVKLSEHYEMDYPFAETLDERESQFYYNTAAPILITLFESIETGGYSASSGNTPLDYEQLKEDSRYHSILRTNIGNRDRLLWWLRRTLSNMEELDQRLLTEIESRR